MRSGWTYWNWPWAYCNRNGNWYFIAAESTPLLCQMPSGPWARLGVQTASTVQQIEARVHQLVNQERQRVGRAPLIYDERIATICRTYSQNMASGAVPPGHDGFDPGRVNQIKTFLSISAWAENVAGNYDSDPAARAVQQWINSTSGHYETMISPTYNYTGVGVARAADGMWYFTQIFVRHP